MTFTHTDFKDLFVIEPKVFKDERGYFFESYNENNWEAIKAKKWVQDNESQSQYGVIRGLHFQKGESAQSKLVRVIKGKVLDVVVDIRKDSETYGRTFSILLSGDNKRQLLIPAGFAHGYAVLEEQTIFAYKCDQFYNPSMESGINVNDPLLNIEWMIPEESRIISEKDINLPLLKNL